MKNEKEKNDMNDNKILHTLKDNLSRIVKNVIESAIASANGYQDLNLHERIIESDIVYGKDGTTSIKFKGSYDRLYDSKPNYSEMVGVSFTYNLANGISDWHFWSNYARGNSDHFRKVLTFSIMDFVNRLSMASTDTDTDTQKPITTPDMTVREVLNTLTPEQDAVLKYYVGAAITETERKANDKIEELKKDLKAACDDYWALRAKLKVKSVISNYPAVIVFWEDGTKTIVKAKDEQFDIEKGIAMAFTKKALGNNYAAGGRLKAIIKHVKIETNKGERKAVKKAIIKPVEEVKAETMKNEKENVKMTKPKKADFVKALIEKGYTKAEAERAWKGMNNK